MGAVYSRLPSLPRKKANRLVITEVFGRLSAQTSLPPLLDLLRDWRPDVVIREPAEFSALVAAAKLDRPQVQVAIDLGGFIPTVADWLEEPIRELERMAGLAEIRGSQRLRATSTLSSVPAALDHPRAAHDRRGNGKTRVWRYRTDGAPSGPSLPGEWGDPTAPLVYVSFGSVTGSLGRFDALYPAVLEVLADVPVRVLVTTGNGYDPARLHPLPGNVWAEQWWPQAAVMGETALMIGHGGFGTTMTAVAAGVPQLVLPLFSVDQFQNAERVESVGIGAQLLGGLDALPDVPRLVEELLGHPRYLEAARRVAKEMADLPDVTTMVAVLQKLTVAT
jgi:UDP:flavonoid glycosyltransferase YjiC (YdhE family)